jgi:uncharacterized iron-regulated membrane protein
MSVIISAAPSPLYRAIWRWHFYAGLMVIPFMMLLAVTGGVYLFKDELNRILYAPYLIVEPQAEAPLSPDEIKARALAVLPGTATSLPAAECRRRFRRRHDQGRGRQAAGLSQPLFRRRPRNPQ